MLESKVQQVVAERELEKQKSAAYQQRITELVHEKKELNTQQKAREELVTGQTKLQGEGEMVELKLEVAKLKYKSEYLEKMVKQQEKEMEVNRLQSKEYLKSCNSLFKQNTTVAASREKQEIR